MRLIDSTKLIDALPVVAEDKKISLIGAVADMVMLISEQPVIEAEPVRHGEWVLGDVEPGYFTPGGNRPWICSECGQVVSWMLGKPNEKYCPNCGAKMGGESDE